MVLNVFLFITNQYYGHTNRFCAVQGNIKPEVLKVQTELTGHVTCPYLEAGSKQIIVFDDFNGKV